MLNSSSKSCHQQHGLGEGGLLNLFLVSRERVTKEWLGFYFLFTRSGGGWILPPALHCNAGCFWGLFLLSVSVFIRIICLITRLLEAWRRVSSCLLVSSNPTTVSELNANIESS